MVINWFGLSSLKISSGALVLVTDPFSKTLGLTPPRLQTDVTVISNIADKAYNNKESLGGDNTFVVDGPGEFDIRGLFIRGIDARNENKSKGEEFDHTTIYSIRMENIRLGFLGSIKQKQLSDEQIDELGDIDILFIPTGGKTVLDAEQAVTITNQVEPSIVIPMHYAQKGLKLKLDPVEQFLKEIGSKPDPIDKLTIKKGDLDGQQTKVVLINPAR